VDGIKINGKAEALNKDGEVILGFYVVGDRAVSALAYGYWTQHGR